eukprot:scaffold8745_cov142-Amphora_coffeaeformis.AAC.4
MHPKWRPWHWQRDQTFIKIQSCLKIFRIGKVRRALNSYSVAAVEPTADPADIREQHDTTDGIATPAAVVATVIEEDVNEDVEDDATKPNGPTDDASGGADNQDKTTEPIDVTVQSPTFGTIQEGVVERTSSMGAGTSRGIFANRRNCEDEY